MKRTIRNSRKKHTSTPTATYKVRFGKGNETSNVNEKNQPVGRIPRVTRLLALAHQIDGMLKAGDLKDWGEAACLIGVTRGRMTQIANLLLLEPEFQEIILSLRPTDHGQIRFTEHDLRSVVTKMNWKSQRRSWKKDVIGAGSVGEFGHSNLE